jgi:hypothetical protein
MNPRVKAVKPNPNHTLTLVFTNGEVRVFDVKPYLEKGIFQELKNSGYFGSVRPFLGSIQWPHGQDFCPDTLYLDSEPVSSNASLDSVSDESSPKIEHQTV